MLQLVELLLRIPNLSLVLSTENLHLLMSAHLIQAISGLLRVILRGHVGQATNSMYAIG